MYLTQSLRRAAATMPNGRATMFGSRIRSWKDVRDRVARMAAGLRRLGVRPGDRLAMLATNSDRYVEYYYFTPWAGGVVVPLNNRWSAAEHIYSVKDSGASILIVDDAFLEITEEIVRACSQLKHVIYAGDKTEPPRTAGYEALISENAPGDDAFRGDADLAGIYYTGGTTGFPKGVMLSHSGIWANSISFGSVLGLSKESVYLHAAPMFHLADGCMTNSLSVFGGTHAVVSAFEPNAFQEAISATRATHALLVPTMIRMLLDNPGFDPDKLLPLKNLMYGASPMPEILLRQFMERLPWVSLYQAYGQTELSPVATVLGPEWHVLDGPNAGKLRSAGRPIHCAELAIVDAQGVEVPQGTVGQIKVRGTTMLGYWNKPVQTAAALVDGWVLTGDGGYLDEEDFLYVVDRMKDMIISGGENVYSAEVENALCLHPTVAECAVIGVPDKLWGERVHAVVVSKPNLTATAEDLLLHCKKLIANYKCPRSFDIRVEALPKSGAGKILKKELRDPFWVDQRRNVN